MPREVDVRRPDANLLTPEREAELNARVDRLARSSGAPVVTIGELDRMTGNPARLDLRWPEPQLDEPTVLALNETRRLAPVLGLAPNQPPEFRVDPNVQQTSSGAASVHMAQDFKGVPIFQAALTFRLAPGRASAQIVGTVVTVSVDVPLAPTIPPGDAVLKAATEVAEPDDHRTDPFGEPESRPAVDVGGFEPTVVTTFPTRPEQPTVFAPGPFKEPMTARLCWFFAPPDLRLAWEVLIVLPDDARATTLVDAGRGDVLFRRVN